MLAFDKILEILHNGNWYKVVEVAEKAGTLESKVELVSSFLSAYDFLVFDKKNKRIRLSTHLQRFLKKIKEIERKEALGKNTLLRENCST